MRGKPSFAFANTSSNGWPLFVDIIFGTEPEISRQLGSLRHLTVEVEASVVEKAQTVSPMIARAVVGEAQSKLTHLLPSVTEGTNQPSVQTQRVKKAFGITVPKTCTNSRRFNGNVCWGCSHDGRTGCDGVVLDNYFRKMLRNYLPWTTTFESCYATSCPGQLISK